MKRNMYSAEYNEVTVKITEKQFDRLDSYEVLELLIKKGCLLLITLTELVV